MNAPSAFQCAGRQSRPCAEVLPMVWQNAHTARPLRRPEDRWSGCLLCVRFIDRISNIDLNHPFQHRNSLFGMNPRLAARLEAGQGIFSPPAVTCFAGARSRRTDLRVFFRASGRHAPSGTGADPGRAASHFIGAALGRFAADFCSAPFLSGRFSRPGRPGTGSRIWLYLRKGEALFG